MVLSKFKSLNIQSFRKNKTLSFIHISWVHDIFLKFLQSKKLFIINLLKLISKITFFDFLKLKIFIENDDRKIQLRGFVEQIIIHCQRTSTKFKKLSSFVDYLLHPGIDSHWDFLASWTISSWAASVSALPFFQKEASLFPPLTHLTSMTPVTPLAEWALTETPKSLARRSLSLVAGPPYPHAPQYSISIDDINKINMNHQLKSKISKN